MWWSMANYEERKKEQNVSGFEKAEKSILYRTSRKSSCTINCHCKTMFPTEGYIY